MMTKTIFHRIRWGSHGGLYTLLWVLVAALGVSFLLDMGEGNAYAASYEVTAQAEIIAPISIVKTSDLQFGGVVPGTTAGTVIMSTSGTRTKTGGVIASSSMGYASPARFNVAGNTGATYSISLPTSVTIKRAPPNANNKMTVNAFVSNPSGTSLLTGTAQVLSVGATLNVGANQPGGAYTATFQVTVNYN